MLPLKALAQLRSKRAFPHCERSHIERAAALVAPSSARVARHFAIRY